MEKSKFGKETTYLWRGNLSQEQVSLIPVSSTLVINDEEKIKLKEDFKQAKAKNPNFFNGPLWRLEGHNLVRGGVEFLVSPTYYLEHNIKRNQVLPFNYNTRINSNYVNPFSINAIQETSDNYLLIGVKGVKSDQIGLGVMGAGFIKRKDGFPPENLFGAVLRECQEETSYSPGTELNEGSIEDWKALGAIWGSNHDTTVGVYVPLKATSKQVDLGNQEHSDLWFLKTDKNSLEKFLNEGGMNGANAVDHLLGGVELYLESKCNGLLKNPYSQKVF